MRKLKRTLLLITMLGVLLACSVGVSAAEVYTSHRVAAGESVYLIAEQYGLPPSARRFHP